MTHKSDTLDPSMSRDSLRAVLNGAIEALLAEAPIQTRLSRVDPHITELEQRRSELPEGCWETLKRAVAVLASSKCMTAAYHGADDYLSSEQEFALTEELLSLYITTNGGALIL